MAQPQVEEQPLEVSLEDKIKHKLPGYTVDILLERGDISGAKTELERLLLEGIDSGPAIEITPEYFRSMRERLRQREETRNTPRPA